MDPVLFRIGPLTVRWYGVLVVTGVLAAAWLSTVEARRRGEDPDHVWNLLTLALLLGTGIGWAYYREHPLDIIAFWRGGFQGLGIFGAITGGIVALALYSYWAKLRFVRWLDIASPGVLLAQAIGRWGNFINQELYGKPTDLPWAIYIDPAHRLPGYEQFERFHPTFLYESLWNLAMCLLLLWIARRFARWLLEGDVFLLYIAFYCVGRTWVQTLRLDQWIVGQGIPFEQVLPAALALLAGVTILLRHSVLPRKGAEEAPALKPDMAGAESTVEEHPEE